MVMKMLIKQLKEKDNWIYIIIALLCIVLFFNTFWNADEIWNYNFAKCIVDGLQPYKDINMVSTPLSMYICAIFLKLFGKGLLAYRVASYLLMVLTFALLYKLNRMLCGNTLFAFMAMFMMYVINYRVYIYNYNNVALVIILIVLLLELDKEKLEGFPLYHAVIGILIGLLPLIKQSIGLVMLIVHVMVCGLYMLKLKQRRKRYILRIIISGIPSICYFIYLLCSDTLIEFIDYAMLGIQFFSYRITLLDYILLSPINFAIALFPIIVIAYGIFDLLIKRNGCLEKYVCSIYSIAWFSIVSYPMSDEQHLFAGIIPLTPLLFLYLGDRERHKEYFFYGELFLGSLLLMIYIVVTPTLRDYQLSKIRHYEGIPIDEKVEENINTVCNYIEIQERDNYKVYMAFEYAAIYMIPLDHYTKNWDLLLVGNLGTTSVDALLDKDDNSLFLIPKSNVALNKMAHIELINYIRQNYVYIDEVEQFDVYRKN